MRDNRRYYLHQRIKHFAEYNAYRKEVSVPNNASEAIKNKYVIELRDKYAYNIQLTIPAGPEYLIEVSNTLKTKLEKANAELTSIQKAINVIQNSCEHKMNDGSWAWRVIAYTHKEVNECLICKKRVTA